MKQSITDYRENSRNTIAIKSVSIHGPAHGKLLPDDVLVSIDNVS